MNMQRLFLMMVKKMKILIDIPEGYYEKILKHQEDAITAHDTCRMIAEGIVFDIEMFGKWIGQWIEHETKDTCTCSDSWIPTKERLPVSNELVDDVDKYYLVQNAYDDMMVAHYDGKGWKQIYDDEYDEVVAWMELPKRYVND